MYSYEEIGVICLHIEFQMVPARGGKWSLIDIADHTQLGSPARLATKRRMIRSSSSRYKIRNNTVRRLERQLQESQAREEQLQRRAGELQTQVDAANRRAGELQGQVQVAEVRVQDFQRSLAETTQELRQCEGRLQANSTHWIIRREEIELTGRELGVGGWATVTVAKFRGIQVAVKRIHN